MSSMLKTIAVVAVVAVVAFVGYRQMTPALPVDINVGETPLAIHGYDPVAYFTMGEARRGSSEHRHEYQGATFHFVSAEHRDLFAAESEKYMPAYGGFCSFGVTQSRKFDIDPLAWEIVNGKLYLQLDPGTRTVWMEDTQGNIATADTVWPEIRDVPREEL
jgi:YHS domain-containing protein